MNLFWHLIRKDHRYLKWLIIAWFLLLIPDSMLALGSLDLFQQRQDWQSVFRYVGYIFPFLQKILMIVIIPRLILEEPVVGTKAYWFTRPIPSRELFKSKLFTLLFWFIFLPLVVEVVILLSNGVGFRDLFYAIPELLLKRTWFVLGISIVSILAADFGKFGMIFGGYYIGSMVLGSILGIGRIFESHLDWREAQAMARCHEVISMIIILIVGTVAVYRQYLYRRTRSNWIILSVAYLITMTVPYVWKWNFLEQNPKEIALIDSSEKPIEVKFSKNQNRLYANERELKGKRYKSVSGALDLQRKDETSFWIAEKCKGSLYQGTKLVHADDESEPNYRQLDVRHYRDLFKILNPTARYLNDQSYWSGLSIGLLLMPEDLYLSNSTAKNLRYHGELTMSQYHVEEVGRTSLVKGGVIDAGSERDVVQSFNKIPGGFIIRIQSQEIRLLFKKSSKKADSYDGENLDTFYALFNPVTGEILSQGNDRGGSQFMRSERILNKKPETLTFAVDLNEKPFASEMLDDIWLKNAFLVRYQLTKVARTIAQVDEKDFLLTGTRKINAYRRSEDQQKLSKAIKAIRSYQPNPDLEGDALFDEIQKLHDLYANRGDKTRIIESIYVDALAKLCAKHPEGLLEIDSDLARKAIEQLANEGLKPKIIEALSENENLIYLINQRGWQKEALPVILKKLKSNPAETGWLFVELIARQEDPTTYPYLIEALEKNRNPRQVYDRIKNLPGIDLAPSIARLWKTVRYYDEYRARSIAEIAKDFGYIENFNEYLNPREQSYAVALKEIQDYKPNPDLSGDALLEEIQKLHELYESRSPRFGPAISKDLYVNRLFELCRKNPSPLLDIDSDLARLTIEKMADESMKSMVIEGLPRNAGLVWVVSQRGWGKEAAPKLLEKLRENPSRNYAWHLELVAQQEDPTTYPLLLETLEKNDNPKQVYERIKNIPGLDLKPSIQKLLKKASYTSMDFQKQVAQIAANYGLEAGQRILDQMTDQEIRQQEEAIQRFEAKSDLSDSDRLKAIQRLHSLYEQRGKKEGTPAGQKRPVEISKEFYIQKLIVLSKNHPEELLPLDSELAVLALEKLVDDKLKAKTLKAFESNPRLLTVIRQKGWEKEVLSIVIDQVHANPVKAPFDFIEVVAQQEKKETYPDLLLALEFQTKPNEVYDRIKRLPGIDLKPTVDRMWKKALYSGADRYQSSRLVAVDLGLVKP